MRFSIEVPSYDRSRGIQLVWDDGHEIWSLNDSGRLYLKANREGLITLARLLLTLAQDDVPLGSHVHLDFEAGLEEGSAPITLERS